MKTIRYQHCNQYNKVIDRCITVTDEIAEKYRMLSRWGYRITTDHDGHDRILVTIETDWYQRSPYRPSADTICSYADVAEAINTVTEQAFSSVYITQQHSASCFSERKVCHV